MTQFRQRAILAATAAALIAGATAATAQTTVITREPAQTVVTEEPLALTPVQRRTIYRTIVREPAATRAPEVEYRVGTRVPAGVELRAIPESVAVEVPAIRRYRYMTVNNRVVLVDPATSEVVEEVVE
jgi:hypothetical protein